MELMFYLLVKSFESFLEANHLGFLRVFGFVTFQVVFAVMLSFATVMLLGESVIGWLTRKKIDDAGKFDQAAVDAMMQGKHGTPTMGGILIIFAIAVTIFLLADLSNFYVQMALVCLIWLGAVGAIDDYLKLTIGKRAGSRQGLTSLEKLLFQIGLAVVLSFFTWNYAEQIPQTSRLYLPFVKEEVFYIPLTMPLFILVGVLLMTGYSNAVNLTDGLDGLASGCMAFVSFAFIIFALILGDMNLSSTLLFPYIKASDQMAVVAGAITGSCLGFLWYNCSPARVFMGDTGSLALGGLIAYVAIVLRQELLLLMIGGVFLAEAVSVILQVGYFKYTRKRFGEGRRIFLMAPLHHHFQCRGWKETQVVVRFWLIGAMLAALGLATIKLR
jgi:phospho-N-acetylmuramoyl-pentapeptide-transferase